MIARPVGPFKRVLVTIDELSLRRARMLGRGNVSGGVRTALNRVFTLMKKKTRPRPG